MKVSRYLPALFAPVAIVFATFAGQVPKPLSPTAPAKLDSAAAQASDQSAHDLTASDLESFLDGLLPTQIEREDIAGVVVAVVKDGHVLFSKGYGFADLEKRKPVTPDATLFRPGSISKLFTWTSVMQLVEQGKIDLDHDVNDYIDYKIPPAFGKPITLRNIMTHSAGFEEAAKDLFVADAAHLYPLERYLKNHIPERIFPPGTTPAYSNYATALAGYIVQRTSGKPFEQYVSDSIFSPLGMKRTTFVQPLPEDVKPLMSNGYELASKGAQPYEFVEAFPAGSVATTARDMTSFMIAHLQNGQFESAQILKPETAKLMHSRTFSPDSRLNAMALGFYEETRNGHRIIGHGGDTVFFHSDLHLILDSNVGMFVSYNSLGKGEVSPRTILFEKFLDRYFPYTPSAGEKSANPAADAQTVAGLYQPSRRFETSFLKLTSLLGQTKVIANTDSTISIDMLKSPNGQLKRFEEIGPLLYRELNGQDHVGFIRDANNRLQFQIDFPIFVFQRISGAENKYLQYAILIVSLVIIVLTVVLWPVAALLRRHFDRPLQLTPAEHRSRRIVRLVCVLDLVLSAGWFTLLSFADRPSTINELAPYAMILEVLGVLAVLGTLFAVVQALHYWSQRDRWIWTRLQETAIALACVGVFWFTWTWNLILNFKLNY